MPAIVLRPYLPGILALEARVQQVHDNVVRGVTFDAIRYAAVDTGEMRSTIHSRRVFARRSHVIVGTDHWMFVEFDTRPHIITPNNKEALYWPGAAHPVKLVHHPGTSAQPFMRPAVYKRRALK